MIHFNLTTGRFYRPFQPKGIKLLLTLIIMFRVFATPVCKCPVAVTSKELRLTRSHFLSLVQDSNRITREEFLAIPCELMSWMRVPR